MNNSVFKTIGSTVIRPQYSRGSALLPILLLMLALSFSAGQVRAQCGSLSAPSTLWQNGGNSFWNIDGNWTSGTPTGSTNACILNGTSTVELNTNGNANGLQLATGNTLNIDSGASLALGTGKSLIFGTLFNSSGTITNFGKLTNNGLVINSGFFGPGSSVAVLFNNSGANLINNGTIGMNMGSLFNNSGAQLTNNGAMGGGDFSTISNSGTFINKSMIQLNNDSSLVNTAGASFVSSGTITVDAGGIFNQGTFNNRGMISDTSTSDPGSFRNSGTFNNTGTISLTLIFNSSDFSNTGTLNNKGTIDLDAGCSNPCFAERSISNSGTINNRGMLNINSTADLGGEFTNSGTINNSGGGTISNALTSTLDNTGTINNTSGAHFDNLGTVTNEGVFNNTSGAHLMDAGTFNNTGTFSNSGAVTISNTGLFTTSTDYTQTAGHTTVNGTLTATGGAIVDIEHGKLSGTGTINGDVLMKGMMSPGSGGVPGTFTVNGNYQQTSTGVFDEIIKSSSANGLLDVSGLLSLDPGSLLEITLQGGFDPVGDSFAILDYGSLSGEFSNGTTFAADGYNWTLTYGSNDAVLTAVSGDPVNTPEPGTIALIAIGFLAFLGFARKRAAAL